MYKLDKTDYASMWRAQGQNRLRAIFDAIVEMAESDGAHAVLFFDEAEGIFRTKGSGHYADADELNVFLKFLDGLEGDVPVTVFIATNASSEALEESALRSGRIEQAFRLRLPT